MTVLPSHLQYNSEIGELVAKAINEMEHKYFHRFDFFPLSMLVFNVSSEKFLATSHCLFHFVGWRLVHRVAHPTTLRLFASECNEDNCYERRILCCRGLRGRLLSMLYTVVKCAVMLGF